MLKEASRYETYPSGYQDEASECLRLPDLEMSKNRNVAELKFNILYYTILKNLGKIKSQLDKNQYKDETKGYNLRIDDKNWT